MHTIIRIHLLMLLLVLPFIIAAETMTIARGSGDFDFHWRDDTTLRVFYHRPAKWGPSSPILFVMHGVKRNADDYRDDWVEHADDRGLLILAPQFNDDDFPGSAAYNLGNMIADDGRLRPEEQWSFSAIEPIFAAVRASTGARTRGYCMYGHSAGAQFVHRFALFKPKAQLQLALAANAGWYTLPSSEHVWPYGLGGVELESERYAEAFSQPLIIMLGEDDTDPEHKYLRRTEEALQQGPHRFARGRFFVETAAQAARDAGKRLKWKLVIVPDVGHSNSGMAAYAIRLLR